MIKAIIFDCFGVLYIDPSNAFYEKHVTDYHRLYPQLKDIDRQQDYGLITQTEHNKQIAELTGLPPEFIDAHIEGEHTLNKDLLLSAQEIRKTHKIGMLSNIGPGSMDKYFTPEQRQSLFDACVLSGEVGITKPHPYIFQMMAEKLGVLPHECVMIDDIEENCGGADAAGMKAILYHTNTQVLADLKRLIEQNA